jgi:hypothetical protein
MTEKELRLCSLMKRRGEFCFLKHTCKHCGQEIPLNPKWINHYLCSGFPNYIVGHRQFGRISAFKGKKLGKRTKIQEPKEPDIRIPKEPKVRTIKEKPIFSRYSLICREIKDDNDYTVFDDLRTRFIKPKTEIKPTLSYDEQLKIAFERLEAQRLEKIKEFEAKPKPILSWEDQLKIAFKRVQQNRENNLKEKSKDAKRPLKQENNSYADRIQGLMGKW